MLVCTAASAAGSGAGLTWQTHVTMSGSTRLTAVSTATATSKPFRGRAGLPTMSTDLWAVPCTLCTPSSNDLSSSISPHTWGTVTPSEAVGQGSLLRALCLDMGGLHSPDTRSDKSLT